MDMQKVLILHSDTSGSHRTPVMANVDASYMIIDGKEVIIKEVNLPSHKFEAEFHK